jgi:hypothetical protein
VGAFGAASFADSGQRSGQVIPCPTMKRILFAAGATALCLFMFRGGAQPAPATSRARAL